jgi:nucleoside-diphosphate-sugar epimerase
MKDMFEALLSYKGITMNAKQDKAYLGLALFTYYYEHDSDFKAAFQQDSRKCFKWIIHQIEGFEYLCSQIPNRCIDTTIAEAYHGSIPYNEDQFRCFVYSSDQYGSFFEALASGAAYPFGHDVFNESNIVDIKSLAAAAADCLGYKGKLVVINNGVPL